MHYPVVLGQENHQKEGIKHDPFKALVSPRPIGWITAMSKKGEINLSPYSFFNALSDRPHIIGFASGGIKDAQTFIEETGEFTCSMTSVETREAMNESSSPLPRGQSEYDYAKIETAPSRFVKPPRVALAPAALECKWLRTIPMTSMEGVSVFSLIIGQVVGIYINDKYVEGDKINATAMQLIARGGYDDYYRADAQSVFELARPKGAGGFKG
jgi:flavin reductase (DIM6/NTAB) family NADH-FMN oxidoreductase RutF